MREQVLSAVFGGLQALASAPMNREEQALVPERRKKEFILSAEPSLPAISRRAQENSRGSHGSPPK